MDVKALYPSIQWGPGCKEIAKAIVDSKVALLDMDEKELVQYIALEYSREEIIIL